MGLSARRSRPSIITPTTARPTCSCRKSSPGLAAGSESPFLTGGLLLSTASIEGRSIRVLSRANQATFSNVRSMGPRPWVSPRITRPCSRCLTAASAVSGGIGAWEGRKSIQDHQGLIYGGAPGVAGAVFGRYADSRGTNFPSAPAALTSLDILRRHASVFTISRGWPNGSPPSREPSPASLTTMSKVDRSRNRPGSPPSPLWTPVIINFADNLLFRQQRYELAYYHRFNPECGFPGLLFPFAISFSSGLDPIRNSTTNIGFGRFPSFPLQNRIYPARLSTGPATTSRPSNTCASPSWDSTA